MKIGGLTANQENNILFLLAGAANDSRKATGKAMYAGFQIFCTYCKKRTAKHLFFLRSFIGADRRRPHLLKCKKNSGDEVYEIFCDDQGRKRKNGGIGGQRGGLQDF